MSLLLSKIDYVSFFLSFIIMHRKIQEVRRKGKDKAKDHFKKTGKYDGKATRRLLAYLIRFDNKV